MATWAERNCHGCHKKLSKPERFILFDSNEEQYCFDCWVRRNDKEPLTNIIDVMEIDN